MADCSVVANIVRAVRNLLDFEEGLVVHTLVRNHTHLVEERPVADIDLEDRTFVGFVADLADMSLES